MPYFKKYITLTFDAKEIKIKHDYFSPAPHFHLHQHHTLEVFSSPVSAWENTFSWDCLWSGLSMSREKTLLLASRSYSFQVWPDHDIQTHPETVNNFNNRTFSHLTSGIISAAYLHPRSVLSINEAALVRRFDLQRQRPLYKYKVWLPNPSAFQRVT